jgi:hypothetical protein
LEHAFPPFFAVLLPELSVLPLLSLLIDRKRDLPPLFTTKQTIALIFDQSMVDLGKIVLRLKDLRALHDVIAQNTKI